MGRGDWSAWPVYDAAAIGLRNYWYPVMWSNQLAEGKPTAIKLGGEDIVLVRDRGTVFGLHDRCQHRGVRLSLGVQEWKGTITCPYHAWTYDLATGELVAVITDGPDSPMCGKAEVQTYPAAEMMGLVWVYLGDQPAPPPADALPEELRGARFVMGGRIDERRGNWRLAAENGYDEGHAKYLHRTSVWRWFKAMPTWNKTHIEPRGRWIYRVQDQVHWEANFPGLGPWSNLRPWKISPKKGEKPTLGNTGGAKPPDPEIARQNFPGFVSITLPGVLRVAYPNFIHYEFYVPIDEERHRYVGVMVRFKTGWEALWWKIKYLTVVRPFFHGNFSNLDAWMVEETDSPPERLYRPDISLIAWRRLVENSVAKGDSDPAAAVAETNAATTAETE